MLHFSFERLGLGLGFEPGHDEQAFGADGVNEGLDFVQQNADGYADFARMILRGGYEGTHFWIDPEQGFVGLIMSQSFDIPAEGWTRDESVRKAIYEQLSPSAP